MASAAMALGLGLRCGMPQRENGNRISLLSNTAGRQKAGVGVKELVMNPSFKHANVMWFKGKNYNAQVFVGEDEPADAVVRRFRKAVMDAGVISECKRRRFFESPQDIAKRKTEASRARKLKNNKERAAVCLAGSFYTVYGAVKYFIDLLIYNSSKRAAKYLGVWRIIQAKAFRKENERKEKESVANDDEDDDYWGGPDDDALPF